MMKRLFTLVIFACIFVSACAQEIATFTQGENIRTAKVSPTYRTTRNSIRIAIGTPVRLGVEYNRWLKPWLMIGVGTGYGLVGYEEYPDFDIHFGYGIPWYVEVELRTPKYKWSLFFNLKLGYGLGFINSAVYNEVPYEWKPFFALVTGGFGYKKFSMGVGVGLLGGHRCASLLLSYDIPLR